MSLCLADLRSIRATLCHTFDKRFGMPPAHQIHRALQNLELEIERLENIERVTKQLTRDREPSNVVSIELARAKRLLD